MSIHTFIHKNKSFLTSITGFTLAEVLIVLGIVGIIAEMTIPTLISDFEDKAAVVALKSEASNLQQAISLAVINEGNIENWYSGTDNRTATKAVATTLSKYLKAYNCDEVGAPAICASSDVYKNGFNQSLTTDLNQATFSKIVLLDGSILHINAATDTSQAIVTIYFYIDVNGLKAPNRTAYDVFYLYLYSAQYANANGLKSQVFIPYGKVGGTIDLGCGPKGTGIGTACTSWAYYNDNRDYIHCRSDLNWDTKTTCD